MKTDLYIEYGGEQTNYKMLFEKAKEVWKEGGNKVKDLLTLELFYKPEEGRCFYVINGDITGSFMA